MAKKTKKEWVEWFNSLDDDVEIEFQIAWLRETHNGKVQKITIYA